MKTVNSINHLKLVTESQQFFDDVIPVEYHGSTYMVSQTFAELVLNMLSNCSDELAALTDKFEVSLIEISELEDTIKLLD